MLGDHCGSGSKTKHSSAPAQHGTLPGSAHRKNDQKASARDEDLFNPGEGNYVRPSQQLRPAAPQRGEDTTHQQLRPMERAPLFGPRRRLQQLRPEGRASSFGPWRVQLPSVHGAHTARGLLQQLRQTRSSGPRTKAMIALHHAKLACMHAAGDPCGKDALCLFGSSPLRPQLGR